MKTILVIDDCLIIRQSLILSLKDRGYRAFGAENGEKGLRALEKQKVDLVLLDHFMPGMDGFQTFKAMKKKFSQCPPVIMVTSNNSTNLAVEFMKTGGNDFMEKPINFEILDVKIQQALKALELQRKVRESEKMAALGGLVVGIAHEINTPVGVGVTAASYMKNKTEELAKLFHSGELKKSKMESYMSGALEASDIILSNLSRASDLVKSFKNIAVDQTSGEQRTFHIKEYTQKIILTLYPKLKKKQHIVTINCPEDLKINSKPGAFSQIMTNLVLNSLTHGFENMGKGEITIEFSNNGGSVLFHYRDNGKGMAEEDVKKIFDPFFTTKRGQGCSGLGMQIVYNLVTQTLKGSIKCQGNIGKGLSVSIEIPKKSS